MSYSPQEIIADLDDAAGRARPDMSGSGAVYGDQGLWRSFSEAAGSAEFTRRWLELQCALIGGVSDAVLVLGPPDVGPFGLTARLSADSGSADDLHASAELALEERRGIVQSDAESPDATAADDRIAYPLIFDDRLYGVVAVSLVARSDEALRAAMRQLQWGSAWVKSLVAGPVPGGMTDVVAVLELVAVCFRHERFQGAATGLVTELASRVDCERVGLGFSDRARVKLSALSHSADFAKRSDLVRAIETAMAEAIDQQSTVAYSSESGPGTEIDQAHARLAEQRGDRAVLSVPFGSGRELLGAFSFERGPGRSFEPETIALCEHAARLIGPIMDTRRREDRWLYEKVWESARRGAVAVVGAGHLALKVALILAALVGAFLLLATGEYGVTADAHLEGIVQRAVVAPLDGYVAEARVRAGEIVEEGDVMATLDRRDLVLQQLKWESEREARLRGYRDALSRHDRVEVMILEAQIEQAEAELELLTRQVERTRLVAPFGGMVVSGDLSQSLDAPVTRGDVLFEVAPLDGYRVILALDERDVRDVAAGQVGELILAGLPGDTFRLRVENVTPVAAVVDARNTFRVEAALESDAAVLRPGMEGVAKVSIGERKLVWIWTRRIIGWVRLWAWRMGL